MVYTAAVTVLSLFASVVLTLAGVGAPAAVAHLAFAVGIVPLIFGAMIHFVPVLTRSGNPGKGIALAPSGAQLAGLAAAAAMQGLVPRGVLSGAAILDFLLAGLLLGWVLRRARHTLGRPHPGWRWYGASLSCLLLALAAVPVMAVFPDAYGALRAWHLHLNTLGLVGLAALGTLPVLLPTALGKPDPDAAGWLASRLGATAVAVIMVALGAALLGPLSIAGAILLMAIAFGLGRRWWRRFGPAALWADGAAASLALALAGFVALAAAGMLHGVGLLPARPSIPAWAVGFLCPLVTGALSQLLPVWRWPGPATPTRAAMRKRLTAAGRWRGLAFLAGGLLLAAENTIPGLILGAGGIGAFGMAMIRAWWPASAAD